MTTELVVLQSFPDPRLTTNPYLVLLARSLEATPGLTVRTFSWRRALLGHYDVFHAHWPENLMRSTTWWKARARQVLFALLLARIALTGTAVVRTVHNLERHESSGGLEGRLLRAFDRQTAMRIALNNTTPDEGKPMVVIPHGHYRDWYAPFELPAAEPGRLGYVGLIRSYKAVDSLVRAFTGLAGRRDLRLDIAGSPSSRDLADELIVLAHGDDRITLRFAYVADDELADRVGRAEMVVLPYREMHNSGGALLALSLDRPVLVPDNEVNRLLAAEVGPGWVHTYPPPIRPEHLERALDRRRSAGRLDRPDLDARNWSAAGPAHLAAYREAMTTRSRKVTA